MNWTPYLHPVRTLWTCIKLKGLSRVLCIRFGRKWGLALHVTLTECEIAHLLPELSIFMHVWYIQERAFWEGPGLGKLECSTWWPRFCYVLCNLIWCQLWAKESAEDPSVWINRCFLHFTGQQGRFEWGKGNKRYFSSPSHCVYVQTFSSQRILCCTSPSTNTGSLPGKCCGLLLPMIPLPPFAHNCPSFLSARSDGPDVSLIKGQCAA